MIEQAAKILIGTAFYVAVLWLAGRNPRATGMMLTFPTLNGIVLLMAGPAAVQGAAGAMLLMPPFNAVICAAYLAGFERLAARGRATPAASAAMIAAMTATWFVFAAATAGFDWAVPVGMQASFIAVVAVSGVVLTFLLMPRRNLPPAVATSPSLATVLSRNRIRIVLFVSTLALVAAVQMAGGAPAVLGAMAGLPIIALFGLHSIACDPVRALEDRRGTLAGMAAGVWLGPVVAAVFVALLWRVLATLPEGALLAGTAALLAGWCIGIAAVWAIAGMVGRVCRIDA